MLIAKYNWNEVLFYEDPIKVSKFKIRICAVRLDMARGFFKQRILYDGIIISGRQKGDKLSNLEENFLSR